MKKALKGKTVAALVVGLALAMTFALSACSGTVGSDSTSDGTAASVNADTQTSDSASDTGPIKVTDATGKEFTFDKPVTKVIGTHNPTMNSVIVVGGGGKYLAGFGYKGKADGLYSNVIDNWDEIPSIGSGKDVNLETIAKLNPDLAVVPERQVNMIDEYAKIDLDTFVVSPLDESFDSIKESLTRLGALFGEDERAESINAEFDEVISEASEACAGATDQPSVLFMGDDLYEVATDSMIQTDIIDTVGAKNAVEGDYEPGKFAEVDAEAVAAMNPDVIWIPNYASYTVDDILADDKLASVAAVQNEKVYQFPSNLEPWDYPTASTCLGVCWAANNLYPDLYTRDQLVDAADEFYTLVYGKTFSAEQLGI
jgi:iron complex transport system substrate-binding protein